MEAVILIAVLLALVLGLITVSLRDLVYSSLSLALLGIATASVFALLGYKLPAILVILVYVGSAVMLLVVSVSMIGGVEKEPKNFKLGATTGLATFVLSFIIYLESREVVSRGLFEIRYVDVRVVAERFVSEHPYIVVLLALSLLVTAIEGLLLLRWWGVRR
ncbi:MAG: NADH-quinone oxidoreductase subunit J [Acidilobaceae archaeon]